MKIYSTCGSGSTPPSHLSFQNMLIAAIQHRTDSFIVIDALDECREISRVGRWFEDLASRSMLTGLHVLFSSRDVPRVLEVTRRFSHETVEVNKYTAKDIELFIDDSIMASSLRAWRGELRDAIKESLYDRADGMCASKLKCGV